MDLAFYYGRERFNMGTHAWWGGQNVPVEYSKWQNR